MRHLVRVLLLSALLLIVTAKVAAEPATTRQWLASP